MKEYRCILRQIRQGDGTNGRAPLHLKTANFSDPARKIFHLSRANPVANFGLTATKTHAIKHPCRKAEAATLKSVWTRAAPDGGSQVGVMPVLPLSLMIARFMLRSAGQI